jgi:hypothetical protein
MICCKKIVVGFLVFLLAAFTLFPRADEPVIKGKYLGQQRPGTEPKRFAEGIISSLFEVHSPAVFSPDGKEVCWSLLFKKETQGVILFMKVEGEKWTNPDSFPFSTEEYRDVNPAYSPDGKKLYFTSRRPLEKEGKPGASNIWAAEKGETGWSEPGPLDAVVNEGGVGDQVSVSSDGTLYFSSMRPEGKGGLDIYRSKWEKDNNRYGKPENLGEPINTEHSEFGAYIAPDQGYVIFTSHRPGGLGAADLYISFRKTDGSWTTPKNMGDTINSKDTEAFPTVSPDSKYLFFVRADEESSHVYWVSAGIIGTLKHEEPRKDEKKGE